MAKRKNGHVALFERVGNKRLKIVEKYTAAISQMAFAKRTHEEVLNKTGEQFQKRLIHNLDAAVAGFIK